MSFSNIEYHDTTDEENTTVLVCSVGEYPNYIHTFI